MNDPRRVTQRDHNALLYSGHTLDQDHQPGRLLGATPLRDRPYSLSAGKPLCRGPTGHVGESLAAGGAEQIAAGTLDADARPMPLVDVGQAWTAAAVLTPQQ